MILRMRCVSTVIIALSLQFCASVSAQESDIEEASPHVAVLPKSAAQELGHLCSRPGVPKLDATWEPTKAEIEGAESHLSMISKVMGRVGRGETRSEVVEKPAQYYRQYLGSVIGARKLIYLNAFLLYKNEVPSDWRSRMVSFCDGAPLLGCDL